MQCCLDICSFVSACEKESTFRHDKCISTPHCPVSQYMKHRSNSDPPRACWCVCAPKERHQRWRCTLHTIGRHGRHHRHMHGSTMVARTLARCRCLFDARRELLTARPADGLLVPARWTARWGLKRGGARLGYPRPQMCRLAGSGTPQSTAKWSGARKGRAGSAGGGGTGGACARQVAPERRASTRVCLTSCACKSRTQRMTCALHVRRERCRRV
jgi:hypothetical protein